MRQVVHHYADDHLNSYVRFKLALTEEAPTIKPYGEALWADLPDARQGPIEPSLTLLAALHERWVAAWTALREPDWQRAFHHPQRGPVTLEHLACLYAWQGAAPCGADSRVAPAGRLDLRLSAVSYQLLSALKGRPCRGSGGPRRQGTSGELLRCPLRSFTMLTADR